MKVHHLEWPVDLDDVPMVCLMATDLIQLEADLYEAREQNELLRAELDALKQKGRQRRREPRPGEPADTPGAREAPPLPTHS